MPDLSSTDQEILVNLRKTLIMLPPLSVTWGYTMYIKHTCHWRITTKKDLKMEKKIQKQQPKVIKSEPKKDPALHF